MENDWERNSDHNPGFILCTHVPKFMMQWHNSLETIIRQATNTQNQEQAESTRQWWVREHRIVDRKS